MRGQSLSFRGTDRCQPSSSRSSLVIVAAQNAKQRQRLAEKQRVYNKDRRSAVATRVKKVLKALDAYGGKLESEDELKPVEKMMSDAYQEIDKAVVKGIIKLNTASRRKSRLAVAKQNLLIQAGIYTPAAAQTA
ncbi:g5079 [Coccomyxa viridis]|uniref:G5079 protein n=1 Tax=Coccomyxa viridis TaxID=1274662 RepID=A0ABP1FUS3_9CHLO